MILDFVTDNKYYFTGNNFLSRWAMRPRPGRSTTVRGRIRLPL